jgi:hypothetical protein
MPDNGRFELPLLEDPHDVMLVTGLRDHEHALLRFGQQDLVGRHVGLARRHQRRVDVDAGAGARGHLARAGGETGRAHVLDADDVAAPDQLQRRLEQQLLGERVADLYLRSLRFRLVAQLLAGEGRAVDAVAAGARAHRHDRVADAARLAADQLVRAHQTDRHGVHERVPLVRVVEVHLTADVRNADGVAVIADALDDTRRTGSGRAAVERAEAQRIEDGDRPRAHGEDVTQDAAHAGGRAFVRLDRRRVVVRFDLERDGEAVADVDDARVLAGTLQHPRRLRRQLSAAAASSSCSRNAPTRVR